ncbi:hypothetical protein D9756_009056 [Leucocoprinus leucothites]|uniref:Uncharacterized protein n=1 Tax=Leucocoprinus leucothites TaxID=201217 RepID=A0A8H5CZK8_9AGAR|nr:hypothetical protein D9756_009056 [Leucoagaricus leucothites]
MVRSTRRLMMSPRSVGDADTMLTWFYGQKGEKAADEPMVHRPSDSRLLSNLISHEKDYSKELQSLLDSSYSSLASLSAYAAATGQPVSRVITSIAGDFSSADDALRRYKDAVDAWREQLKTLKDMEAEVSTIMRDREILISILRTFSVSRLLKASKNEKPPKDKGNNLSSRRSSVLDQRAPSSSSLSLSLEHSYAPSTPLPTSSKLAAAQAELQACEVHLAEKERQLEGARITALRDGLRIRCSALIECGMSWAEMGRDALHATESLIEPGDSNAPKYSREPYSAPQQSLPSQKALPPHMRAETGSERGYHLSSDLSSIGPSQSASQVNMIVNRSTTDHPSVVPNAPNPILGANGSDIQRGQESVVSTNTVSKPSSTPPLPPPIRSSSPFAMSIHRSNSTANVVHADQRPVGYETSQIQVPPAHAIRDGTIPTVTSTPPAQPEPRRTDSGYITPVSNEDGSRSTLEAPTGHRATQVDEDVDVDGDDEGPNLTKEQRLVKEGKLQVVENPRYHQAPVVSEPPHVDAAPTNGRIEMPTPVPAPVPIPILTSTPPPAPAVDGPLHQEPDVAGVREIQQESELPEPPVEQPPGVPSSVPTGEPQTPKKRGKRPGSPSPQKSGFLGSLKKVFGGGHRESTPLEKAREKREKVREKEMKEREKKEKARERESRREERLREQEEHQREKDERAKVKKSQKQAKAQGRHLSLLVPEESEEEMLVEDDDSLTRYRQEVRPSKLVAGGRKTDKRTPRTDRNVSDAERGSLDQGTGSEVINGYVIKKNTDLEKNLKGGILEAKRQHRQGRGGDAGGFADVGSGTQRGSFVVERGAKVTRSSSVPPRETYAGPSRTPGERSAMAGSTAGSSMVASVPQALNSMPHLADTRFREELNSQNGGSAKFQPHSRAKGVVDDRGYASDTVNSVPTSRIDGLPAAPAFVSPTGAIVITSTTRKPSKKKTSMPPATTSEGANVGRHASILSTATAPGGMSTGLGGRNGSVGVSVVTPQATSGTRSNRKAASVDYGRPGGVTTSSPRARTVSSSTARVSRAPQESLMSIVDNVTRHNRRAWDTGLMESKVDRSRSTTKDGDGTVFLGPVPSGNDGYSTAGVGGSSMGGVRNGMRLDAGARRTSVDGASHTGSEGMSGGTLKAPPRVDRQALMNSLKSTPGSPGRAHPTTTYTATQVNGSPEKRPLKSAMRMSRSPSPDGTKFVEDGRGYAHGYSTGTGKDSIVPMGVLPSVSSLPVEDRNGPPPPVEDDDVDDDDDDSPSTSSYETGHENFDDDELDRPRRKKSSGLTNAVPASQSKPRRAEYFDRRPGYGSPPLATPQSTYSHPQTSQMRSSTPPQLVSSIPSSTPSRRKSVRVSLNPTFSPTPPAIEDEEDEEDRAPYVFREEGASGAAVPTTQHQLPPPIKQVPQRYGTQKSESKTIWDDDSDEDVEYKQAKMMLARAGRGY